MITKPLKLCSVHELREGVVTKPLKLRSVHELSEGVVVHLE